jgi:hypothetical protein
MRDRFRFQPVEFVQFVSDRQVGDEMVSVLGGVVGTVVFEVEGVGAGERVVHWLVDQKWGSVTGGGEA